MTRPPAREVWPHLVRAVPWQPILVGGAVAVGLARHGFQAQEQTLAAAAVALGASFVLDDPAASILASSPSPLWWRRAVRLALVTPMAVATWLIVGYVAHLGPGATVAAGLEAGTLLAVVLSSAAVWARHGGDGSGSVAAAPALLVLVAALMTLPSWPVYPVADHEGPWAVLLSAAVLVLLASSRDPVARPLAGWPRGTRADNPDNIKGDPMNATPNRLDNLKWLAVLPAVVAVPFLFFGLLWVAAVQLVVGIALGVAACIVWRGFSGGWPWEGRRGRGVRRCADSARYASTRSEGTTVTENGYEAS